jgi:hypothetical protein
MPMHQWWRLEEPVKQMCNKVMMPMTMGQDRRIEETNAGLQVLMNVGYATHTGA